MLDDILEILLEIVLDGVVEASGSKKVPMVLRVALASVMLLALLGVCVLMLVSGLKSGNHLLSAFAVILACVLAALIGIKTRAFIDKENE